MMCSGIDVFTGRPVELRFDSHLREVREIAADGDLFVAPGWIDIQVNGFAGVDYNSPDAPHDEVARSIEVLYTTGVTRFYPTVITGGPENMAGALRNLARAKESLREGRAIEGFHIEGPYISPEDGPRGAHPRHWVRKPDLEEYRRWQDAAAGHIRLITLSPEWPEAPSYIETITGDGVVASIGHTKADGAQIRDAVSAGATMSTHLGNGAHANVTRHPNYIWEQLADDRLMAGFITDGIHLPACFVKPAFRAKGLERCFLVTDASSPAAAAPGRYRLGEQEVDLTEDERVVLAGRDKLAGSALRLDRGIEKAAELGKISLTDAVRMATVNAARAGRIAQRQQGLAAGDRADLVRFRLHGSRIDVLETYVDGERVFSK